MQAVAFKGEANRRRFEADLANATSQDDVNRLLEKWIAQLRNVAEQDIGFSEIAQTIGSFGFDNQIGRIQNARQELGELLELQKQVQTPDDEAVAAIVENALVFSNTVSSNLEEARGIVENSLESFDSIAVERNRLADRFAEITDKLTDPDSDLDKDQADALRQNKKHSSSKLMQTCPQHDQQRHSQRRSIE